MPDEAKSWLYVSEHFVGNLISQRGTLLVSWEHIGSIHSYTAHNIHTFKQVNTNSDEGSVQNILPSLYARKPSLSDSVLLNKPKQIERKNVARMVEYWQSSLK